MTSETRPSPDILQNLVAGIVETVRPLRIVLFGSAARGQMGPHSDLDVLVVMPDGTHRRHTAQKLYMELRSLELPTDFVVVTEDDIERYGTNHSLVICPALEEGRVIYRAG